MNRPGARTLNTSLSSRRHSFGGINGQLKVTNSPWQFEFVEDDLLNVTAGLTREFMKSDAYASPRPQLQLLRVPQVTA